MKITILVEGDTEEEFIKQTVRRFLEPRLAGRMPKLDVFNCEGRLPKGDRLKRDVERLLRGKEPADAVIALSDVYTGSNDFRDAADAKSKMAEWVGPNDRFFPHTAQYDFEAWLLPYWPAIQSLAGHNRAAPGGPPESVNHSKPTSKLLKEVFRTGTKGRHYVKRRDAGRILAGQDLAIAAAACIELRAFLNRILDLCDGDPL